MAGEKKLIASWWIFWYGAFFRFIVGPASMALASYVLGIRGDTLRFCILQVSKFRNGSFSFYRIWCFECGGFALLRDISESYAITEIRLRKGWRANCHHSYR